VDAEQLKWFTTLGVGGTLAFAMFLVYRKDALAAIANLKTERELLLDALKGNTIALTSLQLTVPILARSVDLLAANCRAVSLLESSAHFGRGYPGQRAAADAAEPAGGAL
jgi:hypothetical protein